MKNINGKSIANSLAAILSIAAVLTITACSKGPGRGAQFSMPPTPVEVAPVVQHKVMDTFETVGTIEAVESITVVSEIDAVVVSLPFKEGSDIQKGDLIAQLDDSQLSAELDRAEALRDQSKATYDRIKSIVDMGAGAPQDLDDASASLKVAEANLALAKARLAKTRVVAPFEGIIGAREVSTGAFLRAGQAITHLANIDQIRVNFSAPERYLPQLKPGAQVKVSTTAFPGQELSGTIIVVEPVLDTATRNASIVAKLDNPGHKFHAGMSADISAVLDTRPDALTIPNEAVFANGGQSFVYVVQPDSTVSMVPLELGTRTANTVEIVKGLEPGMQVVRAGHQKIYQGAKVMPISNDARAQSVTRENRTEG